VVQTEPALSTPHQQLLKELVWAFQDLNVTSCNTIGKPSKQVSRMGMGSAVCCVFTAACGEQRRWVAGGWSRAPTNTPSREARRTLLSMIYVSLTI